MKMSMIMAVINKKYSGWCFLNHHSQRIDYCCKNSSNHHIIIDHPGLSRNIESMISKVKAFTAKNNCCFNYAEKRSRRSFFICYANVKQGDGSFARCGVGSHIR